MEVLKELIITLRIKSISTYKRFREFIGKFDFSQYIPKTQLQYVVTREMQKFQQWMKKKEYDIVFSENDIDVTYHVTGNRKVDIETAGHELCAEITHFLTGYSSKPILVPETANTEYVNTVKEINQVNLACEIFWDPERHSYWITGKREDVLKAYQIFQEKKKELWFAVPSVTDDKMEWSVAASETAQYVDFEIKFEINTGVDRRLTTRGGTFRVTEYLDMSVIQYMFTHDRKYFRSCNKAAGLSYQFNEGVLTVACRSTLQCTDLDEIGVKLTNFIVHVSSIYTTQLLIVPETIREEFSKKLDDWISGGENKLLADCIWMSDRSAVCLTCPVEHCKENYTVMRDILESCITESELAQTPVEVIYTEGTSQDKEIKKWNRTVEVSGVRKTTSTDSVEFYFENSKRSGGATVEEITYKDGIYLITFESSEVVERVLGRNHKIECVEVEVKKHIPFTIKSTKGTDKTEQLFTEIWQNFSITVGKKERECLSGELSPTKMQYLLTKKWDQIKKESGLPVTYEVNRNDCNLTVGDRRGRQSTEDVITGLVEYFKALLQTTHQTTLNIQDKGEGFLRFIQTYLWKYLPDVDAVVTYNKRSKEIVITGKESDIRRCQRVIEQGMEEYRKDVSVVHKNLNLMSSKVKVLSTSEFLKKDKSMLKCKVDIDESEGILTLAGSSKEVETCEHSVMECLKSFKGIGRQIERGVQILLSYPDTVTWINEKLLSKGLDILWEVTDDGKLQVWGSNTELCKEAGSYILSITSPVTVNKTLPYINEPLMKLFLNHTERKLFYDSNIQQCYATDDVRLQILESLEQI